MAAGDVGGKDRTARGAAFDKADGEGGGGVDRDDAAAGMDEKDRAGRAVRGQTIGEAAEVAGHHRADIGIGAGGGEAFVFAHLRRDIGGERNRKAGLQAGDDVAHEVFVRGVEVGMQETHRDGFVAREAGREVLDLGQGEGDEDVAACVDAFAQGQAVVAGDQRIGQGEVEVVLFEARFGAHLDHVTEAFGRDEGGAGAAPFDQRVGGKCGAVDDAREPGRRDAGAGADLCHAVEDGILGRGVGGQDLDREETGRGFEHHVGEGAADVDAEMCEVSHGVTLVPRAGEGKGSATPLKAASPAALCVRCWCRCISSRDNPRSRGGSLRDRGRIA